MIIAFGRCLVATLLLFLLDVGGVTKAIRAIPGRDLARVFGAGTLLALHFALFLVGLDLTSLPAGISLVSLEPMSVVVWAFVIHRIVPTRLESIGVFIATVGAFVVARGAGSGEHRLLGDLIVVAAVVVYGLYVASARTLKDVMAPHAYAATVYGSAGIVLALALLFVPTAGVRFPLPGNALLAIAGLALLPTLVGHTLVQIGSRTLSPSTVALISPGETIGGLVIAAVAMHAAPTGIEMIGGGIVLFGAAIAIFGARA